MRRFVLTLPLILTLPFLHAEEPSPQSVEDLAERGRKSLVVISHAGRDGRQHGIGTGFVVNAEGLIATNLHVIGEGRAIRVELPDGSSHDVTEVHATDRAGDLAIIRIKARGLTPLPLGNSDQLKDGQSIVALGNPQGLKGSVVSGVVSGRRTIDGRSMIQLAIPVEPGNSGGPLLDRQGRVVGVVTLKSAVTQNLGFAMPVSAVKPLLERPNPVSMDRWVTLGALDTTEWTVMTGARWRRRAGRILVDGLGSGFGGRSLCLSNRKVPAVPVEVAVSVKLNDERGAAGLAFHADGGDRHYGFYPTNGELRLTRFDGPDVFTWKILAQKSSESYRPGEWNTLKVRIEKDRLQCFVNGQLVIESTDDVYRSGKLGLVKFRDTAAEFKGFAVGATVGGPSPERTANIRKLIDGLPTDRAAPDAAAELLARESESPAVLQGRATELEQQAGRLRELAKIVHHKHVLAEIAKTLTASDAKIDLTRAALLIARLDNEEVDVAAYQSEIERMARTITDSLPPSATEEQKIAAVNRFLFQERGFRGSRSDYYHKSNSYLNEVIDDREGLPLTLSVLYLELARRQGLRMEGVALPGHFVVRHVPTKGEEATLIDVYDNGKRLTREDARAKVKAIAEIELNEEHLKAVGPRTILVRMLHNLLNLSREERDLSGAGRYLDAIVTVDPSTGPERWMRAVLRYQTGRRDEARTDVDWLLQHTPEGVDLDDVRGLKRLLDRPE